MGKYSFFLIPFSIILLCVLMIHPASRRFAQGTLVWGAVLFLASVGLCSVGMGLRAIWRGVASEHWPTVPATVVAAEVSETEGKITRRRDPITMYTAKVTFSYEVDGRNYSSETIQHGRVVGSGDFTDVAVLLLPYPPGAKVDIRHHPTDPSIAAAKPGVNGEVVLYVVAGMVLLVLGAVAGLVFLAVTRDISLARYAHSLVWFIMVFLGLGMLGPGLRNLWNARASPSWPRTRGVIIFAETNAENAGTQAGENQASRSTAPGVPLAYQYEVGGVKHFSNICYFGQFTAFRTLEQWAEDFLARYPSGADVLVSYCPTDPDVAALEPGINRGAYYLPGAGAAFLVFGLLAAILSWK